jgi:prepilin-type N-terminal cleavage/methylation domain-containing protein
MQFFTKNKKRGPDLISRGAKGFILIELLVVVAILGILTTIIMINVNTSRVKAKNAAIISSMNSLREGGAMWAGANGTYTNFCDTNCTAGSDDWRRVCVSVGLQGGNLTCNNSATDWVASSPLVGGGTHCVDSTNKTGSTAPGAGVYACP